jgi:hypothetical protein
MGNKGNKEIKGTSYIDPVKRESEKYLNNLSSVKTVN